MGREFFPLRLDTQPMIYAYEDSDPEYKGLLKVGYTANGVEQRVTLSAEEIGALKRLLEEI